MHNILLYRNERYWQTVFIMSDALILMIRDMNVLQVVQTSTYLVLGSTKKKHCSDNRLRL